MVEGIQGRGHEKHASFPKKDTVLKSVGCIEGKMMDGFPE